MIVYLVGVHYSGKSIVGFRLLDLEKQNIMDVPYDNTLDVIKSKKATVRGIESQGNKLRGSNGIFSRYPKITGGQLLANNAIIIIKQVGDEGYVISDWQGNIKTYRNDDIIKLTHKMPIANGKVVERDNGKFISAINGEYDRMELTPSNKNNSKSTGTTEQRKVDTTAREKAEATRKLSTQDKLARLSGKQPVKQDTDENTGGTGIKLRETVLAAPRITGGQMPQSLSQLKNFDENTGMTLEQKMARAMLTIRKVRSFYYAILSTIQRIETTEVPTMGVSIDTLYYNPNFVKELSLPELVFVEIHEVCHLAMRHRQRQGTKIHSIWNIACDFYINKLICDEFGIKPGDDPVYPIEDDMENGIQFPMGGMYNENVDINKDTPESIYAELIKQAKQAAQQAQSSDGQSGDGDGGTSDSGTGNSSSSEQTSEDSSETSDGKLGENGEELDTNSGEQQDNGKGEGKGEGKGKSKGNKDTKDTEEGNGNASDRLSELDKAVEDAKFRGKKVGKLKIKDIIDDNKSATMDETQKENRVRTLLERAVVMQKQNTGEFGGESGSWMERYVEEALAPKINWRTLVKNKLTLATQRVNTYSAPDRRFLARKMTLPGPKNLENDALENVKVCIDTSGSISDEDLGIALAQINQLLKVYKANAELIYWDTKVRVCEPFKNLQELLKIMPGGGGGTDVNCVFKQFEGRDYKIGKKQQPSIIIIFTDGYFGRVDDKYKKYRDTIWIVQGNDSFEPPFGVKAPFKHETK